MSVGWISLPICDGLYMLIGIPCKNFEMNASNLDQFVPGLNWIYPPNQVFGWCSSPGIQSYGFGSYISWGPVVYRKGTQRHFLSFQTWWFIIYPEGPLLLLTNFRIGMVKWCAMHLIHLGCDLWIVGNCLKTLLLDTTLWGDPEDGCSDDDRLLTAWQEFKVWARRHKWQLFGCLRYWPNHFIVSLFIWTTNSLNESVEVYYGVLTLLSEAFNGKVQHQNHYQSPTSISWTSIKGLECNWKAIITVFLS